jgi:hypothetical protein
MVGATLILLDVQVKLLQVHGPLLMAVILQLCMCFHELQRHVINVDDCLLPQNVMLPLSTCLHNGVHLFFIGGVSMENII